MSYGCGDDADGDSGSASSGDATDSQSTETDTEAAPDTEPDAVVGVDGQVGTGPVDDASTEDSGVLPAGVIAVQQAIGGYQFTLLPEESAVGIALQGVDGQSLGEVRLEPILTSELTQLPGTMTSHDVSPSGKDIRYDARTSYRADGTTR